MADDLSGRVALIAGASGGFGSAVAEHMADCGATVALVGRDAESLEKVADTIARHGGRAVVACGDLRSPTQVGEIYREIARMAGKPTILIDAAAVPGPFGPIGSFDPEDWWLAMTVHLLAPVLLIHHCLPEMLRLRRGQVILLSSLVGKMVYPYLSAYSVGKGAQAALVAHAAAEHDGSGVSFFAIQPGFAETKMTAQTLGSPDFQKWAPGAVQRIQELIGRTDHQKALRECAERCVQLASGEFDNLSGRFLEPADDLSRLSRGEHAAVPDDALDLKS